MTEILELNIQFSKKKPERRELFNLKNKNCQEAFKEATEINQNLIDCFNDDQSLEIQKKSYPILVLGLSTLLAAVDHLNQIILLNFHI